MDVLRKVPRVRRESWCSPLAPLAAAAISKPRCAGREQYPGGWPDDDRQCWLAACAPTDPLDEMVEYVPIGRLSPPGACPARSDGGFSSARHEGARPRLRRFPGDVERPFNRANHAADKARAALSTRFSARPLARTGLPRSRTENRGPLPWSGVPDRRRGASYTAGPPASLSAPRP
jgi:hypothetical protein